MNTLNLNMLELISNNLSVNNIICLSVIDKYHYSNIKHLIINSLCNKYLFNNKTYLDTYNMLSKCSFKISLLENKYTSIRLYDNIDISDSTILSTLQIFKLSQNINISNELVDYLDDVYKLKYKTKNDNCLTKIFKTSLCNNEWSDLNINLYHIYEMCRIIKKNYGINFINNLKKSIMIDDKLFTKKDLTFMLKIINNIHNKKIKIYLIYEIFNYIYNSIITNNLQKIAEESYIKFIQIIKIKLADLQMDIITKYNKMVSLYFKNIILDLFNKLQLLLLEIKK